MKLAYLVYLGWTVLGILAVLSLGVHEHLYPDPNQQFGNPVVFAALIFAPSILLGWLAGLGLVALFRDSHPALGGTLAYGGAALVAVGLGVLELHLF
ncbi:hypothetical protein ABZS29_00075 [Kribbella sp. NPDC005582]|uniref:hypothetical protein n=1 Tax=Kribbella sp. NPDC005582 TaxID=3156893 RepID=UPI0033B12F42